MRVFIITSSILLLLAGIAWSLKTSAHSAPPATTISTPAPPPPVAQPEPPKPIIATAPAPNPVVHITYRPKPAPAPVPAPPAPPKTEPLSLRAQELLEEVTHPANTTQSILTWADSEFRRRNIHVPPAPATEQ